MDNHPYEIIYSESTEMDNHPYEIIYSESTDIETVNWLPGLYIGHLSVRFALLDMSPIRGLDGTAVYLFQTQYAQRSRFKKLHECAIT